MVYHALPFSVFISLFLLRKVAGRPPAGKKTGRGRDLPHRETRLFDREISLHLPFPAVRIPFFLHLISSASSITLAPFTSPFLSLFSSQSLSSSLQCFALFLTNRPYSLSLPFFLSLSRYTQTHAHKYVDTQLDLPFSSSFFPVPDVRTEAPLFFVFLPADD